MLIKAIEVGYLQTNCYIVADEATLDAAVIDPGADADIILETARENGCDICAISPANTPSWFSTAPPKASVPRCCACNDPVATSAAAHIAICNFLIIRCCLTRLNI
mgnify:CR=1 FL=1